MSLRSISFAGNDLSKAENELHLQRCLHELIQKTYIQHLDLSLTMLQKKTAKVCLRALVAARSIQSLHLTSPQVEQLSKAAQEILGRTLFSHMDKVTSEVEIPDDWNEDFKVPDPKRGELLDSVASTVQGVELRERHAKKQNPSLSFDEQRLVISRLMGRSDLSNHHTWHRHDEHDCLGRPLDIRDDFDDDLRQEVLLGRRKPDDLCWIMSRECWICEMWTYYLPIVSKQDIAESFGGLSQNLK